ncbi:signal peptidase I [Rubidibacter lacunae KORDI 51-2]|uniref:Signal peptidase I n=1 Tax=Rubidibacter lacunae KORDI 51-2 TaxID=582515 RepID=U5D806_9CHRO|nr:signal peptidase I [Rubidibacter lacunae]ERN40758.1 signal peptidase I [Rubidibacter lacunae KORDI 51-2]
MTAKDRPSEGPPPAPKSPRGALRENIQTLAIALVLALLIRTFIAEPRFIPSESMLPTLEVGDRLVIEKVSYRFRPPRRGEIVVFTPPPLLQQQGYESDQAFIKRVVAIEGDRLRVRNGRVFLDGRPLDESAYIAEPPAYPLGPVVVPPESLFVMGDNRNNSRDSHIWGFLPADHALGRAVFRFWPPSRIGPIRVRLGS